MQAISEVPQQQTLQSSSRLSHRVTLPRSVKTEMKTGKLLPLASHGEFQ